MNKTVNNKSDCHVKVTCLLLTWQTVVGSLAMKVWQLLTTPNAY